jgi:hypothetical protein
MERAVSRASAPKPASRRGPEVGGPLVWAFDGPIAGALADLEDALRRAIIQVGDVAAIAVLIELSLPALQRRIEAGDALQPAWSAFIERASTRYGLQAGPRVRHMREDGPLARLVVVYLN